MNTGDFQSSLARFSQLKIGLEGAYQQKMPAAANFSFVYGVREEKKSKKADGAQKLTGQVAWNEVRPQST